MEFSGEYQVPAAADTVWAALVEPDVLQACVPGCESVEKTDEWAYKATCKLKLGPIGLNLSGNMRMEDVNPPYGCKIVGEGSDSTAGHMKGEATVTIEEDGSGGCTVKYTAQAVVSGRIAQLGGRLIDAALKKYADEFFGRFAEYLGGRKTHTPAAERDDSSSGPPQTEEEKKRAIRTGMIIAGVVVVLLLLLFLTTGGDDGGATSGATGGGDSTGGGQ